MRVRRPFRLPVPEYPTLLRLHSPLIEPDTGTAMSCLNRTKKVNIASGETWTYGWDNHNQLVWAEDRATDGGTLLDRLTYK